MPTMNDVAKLAGVSRGTVSNYINGVTVKPTSQKRIQEAIEQLNYIPNVTARSLKMNRTDLVVFIIPTTHTPFFSELTYNMQQELNTRGFKMILCISNNQLSEELEYIQMAKEQKVAGIITISYSDLGPFLTTDVPIISIENKLTDKIPCLSSDNYSGGRLAAKILEQKKVKKMLLITRTTEKTVINYGERSRGFTEYCKENKIFYEVFNSYHHEDEFYSELNDFLKEKYKSRISYDGIFAVSDQYADFAVHTLKQLNREIPKEIQIIGFDGGRMYHKQPQIISSIRQPISQIVMGCVNALNSLLEGQAKKTTAPIYLPVSFVEGVTTKK